MVIYVDRLPYYSEFCPFWAVCPYDENEDRVNSCERYKHCIFLEEKE